MSDTIRPSGPTVDPAKGNPEGVHRRRLGPLIVVAGVVAAALGFIIFAFVAQRWVVAQRADAMALATPTPATDDSTNASNSRDWWEQQGNNPLVTPTPNPTSMPTITPAQSATPVGPTGSNPAIGVLRDPDAFIKSAEQTAGTGMEIPVADDATPAPATQTGGQTGRASTADYSGLATPPPDLVASVQGQKAPAAPPVAPPSSVTTAGAQPPSTPYLLRGITTAIPCTLAVAINSQHQSYPTCVVSDDVYDSIQMHFLLVPRGTAAKGEWHEASVDNKTVLVAVWKELAFPNGWRYEFSGTTEAPDGSVGMPARVDNHGRRIFGNALLLTAVAALATAATGGGGAILTSTGALRPAGVLSSSILQSTSALANATIGKTLNIPPDLHVDFGDAGQIVALDDMPFPSPYPFGGDTP